MKGLGLKEPCGVPNKINVINLHLETLWGKFKTTKQKAKLSKLLKKKTITHEEASIYLIDIQLVCNKDKRDREAGMHCSQSARGLQTRSMFREQWNKHRP